MRLYPTMGLLLTLFASLALNGCGSKKKSSFSDDAGPIPLEQTTTLELNGESDSGRAGELQTVYFPFNSSNLIGSTRSMLDANARYLLENPDIRVRIEGHCDERGGIEYNLALGERRAKATQKYLESMGVDSSRMERISYGKEKPLEYGRDEQAWNKNRRANFSILAK